MCSLKIWTLESKLSVYGSTVEMKNPLLLSQTRLRESNDKLKKVEVNLDQFKVIVNTKHPPNFNILISDLYCYLTANRKTLLTWRIEN